VKSSLLILASTSEFFPVDGMKGHKGMSLILKSDTTLRLAVRFTLPEMPAPTFFM